MLRYISDAPELDNRLVRSLRRLARHQTGLQLLLEMDFQQMVLARLIRRECLLVRSIKVDFFNLFNGFLFPLPCIFIDNNNTHQKKVYKR